MFLSLSFDALIMVLVFTVLSRFLSFSCPLIIVWKFGFCLMGHCVFANDVSNADGNVVVFVIICKAALLVSLLFDAYIFLTSFQYKYLECKIRKCINPKCKHIDAIVFVGI